MVLTVTDPALEKILELRSQEDEPDSLGLRIEVTGVQGVEYTYDLTFDPVSEADQTAGDVVEAQGELPVIVPADSIDALRGATLDLPTTTGQQGLVLRNPNRPDPRRRCVSCSTGRSTRRWRCTAGSQPSTASRARPST